ncbi:riboflavin transporter 2-like isoform X2 [Amblyomma americanum]
MEEQSAGSVPAFSGGSGMKALSVRMPVGWPRVLISACSLMFGVSAWVSVNGLWVQMPLLVPVLPEGWNLGSVLVVVIQVANVGPLAYTLARNHLGIRCSVHVTLFVGLTASVLLVFLWRRTVGAHSVAFIALAFFLACVDCTSSVLYMPFMARYPPQFLFWYMVGEGLSGLVPAALALAQGVGTTGGENSTTNSNATEGAAGAGPHGPRFSVEAFLSMLCVIVALSWMAFSALAHWPVATSYQVPDRRAKKGRQYGAAENGGYVPDEQHVGPPAQSENGGPGQGSPDGVSGEESSLSGRWQGRRLHRWQWWLALTLQSVIACLGNGVLLAVQTYSSLPYGQVPYHLATNLAVIANPLSCAVAAVIPVSNLAGLGLLTAGGLGCAAYILVLALQSPHPVFVGTVAGAAIMTPGTFSSHLEIPRIQEKG